MLTRPIALRLLAIAIGGALGTVARYDVAQAIVTPPSGFPWSTWIVNVTGSLLVGLALTVVVERLAGHPYLRALLVIGFCGGFTTFSTMAVEVVQLTRHHRPGIAVVYLVSSLIAGLVAAGAGVALARLTRLAGVPAGSGAMPDPDDIELSES
jgi:fluoride exporter